MSTVVVPAYPPRDGVVYESLIETTPLTPGEATQLYTATFSDACRAASLSGGDLLVNYPAPDQLPDSTQNTDPEAELRAILADAVDVDVDDTRFEVQVGSTVSARRGNTITHLLEEEDVGSVAILEPDAPFVFRMDIDGVAMSLRRTPVVLLPGGSGSVAVAGFSDVIDFSNAFEPPALTTLTDRSLDADLDVDYNHSTRRLATADDLLSIIIEVQGRDRADRLIPPHTAAVIEDIDVGVTVEDGSPTLRRD